MNIKHLTIIFALFVLAGSLDYQDQVGMAQDWASFEVRGCVTDAECESGIEDEEVTQEIRESLININEGE